MNKLKRYKTQYNESVGQIFNPNKWEEFDSLLSILHSNNLINKEVTVSYYDHSGIGISLFVSGLFDIVSGDIQVKQKNKRHVIFLSKKIRSIELKKDNTFYLTIKLNNGLEVTIDF